MTKLSQTAYDWAHLPPPGPSASRLTRLNYAEWLESKQPTPPAELPWQILNGMRDQEQKRAAAAAAAAAQEAQQRAAQRQAEQNERAKRCSGLYKAIWALWLRNEAGSPQCQKLFRDYAVARGFLAPNENFGSDDTYARVNRDLNSGDTFHAWGTGNESIFNFKYAHVRPATPAAAS